MNKFDFKKALVRYVGLNNKWSCDNLTTESIPMVYGFSSDFVDLAVTYDSTVNLASVIHSDKSVVCFCINEKFDIEDMFKYMDSLLTTSTTTRRVWDEIHQCIIKPFKYVSVKDINQISVVMTFTENDIVINFKYTTSDNIVRIHTNDSNEGKTMLYTGDHDALNIAKAIEALVDPTTPNDISTCDLYLAKISTEDRDYIIKYLQRKRT